MTDGSLDFADQKDWLANELVKEGKISWRQADRVRKGQLVNVGGKQMNFGQLKELL